MPNGWKLMLPDGDADDQEFFLAVPAEVHEIVAGTLARFMAEPPQGTDNTIKPDDLPGLFGLMPHDITGGYTLS